jgi:hypothetical protein
MRKEKKRQTTNQPRREITHTQRSMKAHEEVQGAGNTFNNRKLRSILLSLVKG